MIGGTILVVFDFVSIVASDMLREVYSRVVNTSNNAVTFYQITGKVTLLCSFVIIIHVHTSGSFRVMMNQKAERYYTISNFARALLHHSSKAIFVLFKLHARSRDSADSTAPHVV